MNCELAEKIADAVLYEGYMLYPYRPSALKNRQRWSFGTLYPPAYDEVGRGTASYRMHTECLLQADGQATIDVLLRFLRIPNRPEQDGVGEELEVDSGKWDGGEVCCVNLKVNQLAVPSSAKLPCDYRGEGSGNAARTQQLLAGSIAADAQKIGKNLYRLAIDVRNESALPDDPADHDEVLRRSMLSTHVILTVVGGAFISLLDPAQEFRQAANNCRNIGNFPVLLGAAGSQDTMLCSPILLYDYPQIAPESIGDFFDSTEMDEMLTLRVLTLTDAEKNEMRHADARTRSLLQRTEESAHEQLMKTHGAIRSLRPAREQP